MSIEIEFTERREIAPSERRTILELQIVDRLLPATMIHPRPNVIEVTIIAPHEFA